MRRSRAYPAIAAALLAVPADGAAELTERERAGKAIYLTGESPSGGAIHAQIGVDTMLPASAVACVNCHGEDGLGRPEGVVLPGATTWSQLAKRYGHVHDDGRRHPAYGERTLARAVSDGVDPAGNRLDPSMPRYSMSRADMESLVAYLRVLERDLDPGISASAVRIGTLLPARGPLGEIGAAVGQVLRARFDELNRGGGVNGRRIELVTVEHGGDGASCLAAARRLLSAERVFALAATFCPAAEKELAALAEREKVPLVGPITPFTRQVAEVPDRYVFYLLSGVREQARALVDWASNEIGGGALPAAIVHASDEPVAEAARAALDQARARGWTHVELVAHPRGAVGHAQVASLKERGVEVVVFLGGDGDLASFTRAAHSLSWAPHVLLSGSLAARAAAEAPRSFHGRLVLAYPALPSDETPAAREDLARASEAGAHRAARVSAYGAAKVVAEALRRSGKQLSRERFVDKLEALYAFEPGLVPPLTYRRNRHVGALGAHVVAVDLERGAFRPLRWIPVE